MGSTDAICRLCGAKFTYAGQSVMIGGRTFGPTICDACDAKRMSDAEAERAAKRSAAWVEMMRPFGRLTETDRQKLPNKRLLNDALRWPLDGRGLAFVAPNAGLGKTRCAFIALRRAYDAGKRVFAIQATRFERIVTRDVYSDDTLTSAHAERDLARCRECSVLLLDDIDKPKWTPAAEKELFEVLDTRHSAARPTIWTSNTPTELMAAMWSEERRAAIYRRLIEGTAVVEIAAKTDARAA